jgi:hypothetical protein
MQPAWWVQASLDAFSSYVSGMHRWSREERLVFRLIVVFALAIHVLLVLWSVYMRSIWLMPIAALGGFPFGMWVGRRVCELLWPELVAKADQNAAMRLHNDITQSE